jgi:hypothetical protein
VYVAEQEKYHGKSANDGLMIMAEFFHEATILNGQDTLGRICVFLLAMALFLFAMLLASFVLFSLAPRQNCWFLLFRLIASFLSVSSVLILILIPASDL